MRMQSSELRVGDRLGRLVILELKAASKKGANATYWYHLCVCDCGNTKLVNRSGIMYGSVRSCGCLKKEVSIRSLINSWMVNTKHGKTGTPTYTSWESMRGRCNNPNDDNYNSYGGRGIKVCAEWDDFNKFESDLGSRPEGTSLDRINPDGDYEPSNCRWATTKEQNRNQRRTLFVTFRGETVRLADLAELFPEIGYDRIHQRVFYQGWDTEDAVSRPVVKKPKHNNVSTSPKEDNT